MKLALPRLTAGQGVPQFPEGFRRGFAGLQDARILTDNLLAGVAGIANESLVDVFDVGVQIGDENAIGTLFDCQGKLAQLRLGPLALG